MGKLKDWWERNICGPDLWEPRSSIYEVPKGRAAARRLAEPLPRSSSTYTVPRGQPIGSSLRFATQKEVDRIATLRSIWDSPSEFGHELTRRGLTGMKSQRLWFPANVQITIDRMIEVEGRGEIRPADRLPTERWRWTERDALAQPFGAPPRPAAAHIVETMPKIGGIYIRVGRDEVYEFTRSGPVTASEAIRELKRVISVLERL